MLAFMLEVTDVELLCTDEQLAELLQELKSRGISFSVDHNSASQVIRFDGEKGIDLEFRLRGDGYKLVNKRLKFHNPVLAELFRDFVVRYKGHATIKMFRSETLFIHHVQYGEVVRITEVSGNQRKVLLDKKEMITMEKVMQSFLLTDIEERIPKVREAIDTALDELHRALESGDIETVHTLKRELRALRREMLLYEM
ncbi:MAG: hypothetical protein RBR24_04200 [Candidatus Carbobacillus sp.]|nr:hypothetical protein [Candidatus Carbobacillus sp.]